MWQEHTYSHLSGMLIMSLQTMCVQVLLRACGPRRETGGRGMPLSPESQRWTS